MISLLAALILVQDADPAGRYQIEGISRCTVRLQDSLPSLPEANVQGDAVSGFAFASPGCPAGLESLSLWRYAYEAQTLTLVDGAGETLVTATLEGRVWQGQTPGGDGVQLTRN